MADKNTAPDRLEKAVTDYLSWMMSNGYADSTCRQYRMRLTHFVGFINPKRLDGLVKSEKNIIF